MKVGIYDRFLSTLGGGERYACGVGAALAAAGCAVDLICDEPVDRDELGARLDLDLDGVRIRVEDLPHEPAVCTLSADYDLFINATYLSTAASAAPRGVLLVNFPEPDIPRLRRRGTAPHQLEALRARVPAVGFGAGFRPVQGGGLGYWCGPEGILHLPADPPPVLRLLLRLPWRGPTATTRVRVRSDTGAVLARTLVEAGHRTWLTVPVPAGARTLVVEATGFVPAVARFGYPDREFAGVIVDAVVDGTRPRPRLGTPRRRRRLARAVRLAQLDTYQQVVANSQFTRRWVWRAWGREASVVYPPVTLAEPPAGVRRVDRIIHVGRFFPRGQAAHYKGQLELLDAFRRLPPTVREGWELVFVGGVHPGAEELVAELADRARGLPVRIVPDASRGQLWELLWGARIYWHATGVGVPERRAPEVQEHFGISTVEAMAAGVVPVVIDQGGQREVVRDGVDGFRWRTIEELCARTVALITDPDLWRRMHTAAQQRARAFSWQRFRTRAVTLLLG